MKLVIAGSRHFTDFDKFVIDVSAYIDEKPHGEVTEIVSGGANGTDAMAERFANLRGIPFVVFPADWERYHRAAGPIRNRRMASYGNALLAFRAPGSRGTQDMIWAMVQKGKPVRIIDIE